MWVSEILKLQHRIARFVPPRYRCFPTKELCIEPEKDLKEGCPECRLTYELRHFKEGSGWTSKDYEYMPGIYVQWVNYFPDEAGNEYQDFDRLEPHFYQVLNAINEAKGLLPEGQRLGADWSPTFRGLVDIYEDEINAFRRAVEYEQRQAAEAAARRASSSGSRSPFDVGG